MARAAVVPVLLHIRPLTEMNPSVFIRFASLLVVFCALLVPMWFA